MDVWVSLEQPNALRLVSVLNELVMVTDDVTPALFLTPENIVRMGVPPVRIAVLNETDGANFPECAKRATNATLDGLAVRLISLGDLRRNKRGSGRYKVLDDQEHLPKGP